VITRFVTTLLSGRSRQNETIEYLIYTTGQIHTFLTLTSTLHYSLSCTCVYM